MRVLQGLKRLLKSLFMLCCCDSCLHRFDAFLQLLLCGQVRLLRPTNLVAPPAALVHPSQLQVKLDINQAPTPSRARSTGVTQPDNSPLPAVPILTGEKRFSCLWWGICGSPAVHIVSSDLHGGEGVQATGAGIISARLFGPP